MQHKGWAMRHDECYGFQRKEKAHPATEIRGDLQHELRSQDGDSGSKSMDTGNGRCRHVV